MYLPRCTDHVPLDYLIFLDLQHLYIILKPVKPARFYMFYFPMANKEYFIDGKFIYTILSGIFFFQHNQQPSMKWYFSKTCYLLCENQEMLILTI